MGLKARYLESRVYGSIGLSLDTCEAIFAEHDIDNSHSWRRERALDYVNMMKNAISRIRKGLEDETTDALLEDLRCRNSSILEIRKEENSRYSESDRFTGFRFLPYVAGAGSLVFSFVDRAAGYVEMANNRFSGGVVLLLSGVLLSLGKYVRDKQKGRIRMNVNSALNVVQKRGEVFKRVIMKRYEDLERILPQVR